MKSVAERAAAGNRAAMMELYEANKQKVYYSALLLLGDKKQAAGAAAAIFRKAWNELGAAGISTEKQFSNFCMVKLAEYCRPKLSKGNEIAAVDILNAVGGLGYVHIAKAMKLDAKLVRAMLDNPDDGFERYSETVRAECAQIKVPDWVDQKATEGIEAVAGPVEAAEKKRKRALKISAIAVSALIVIVVLVSILGGGKNNAPAAQDPIYADIAVKDYGTITVELDPSAAPITVENFVSLAESGFYDGLTFHRIMEGFMMQGGDPLGNGTGGSAQSIAGEFAANGYDTPLSHTRGAISMARAQPYDSASSQFFIVHADSTFLDGQYAVFGYVTEGIEIVDAICTDAKPVDGNGTIPAAEQPVIESVTVRR